MNLLEALVKLRDDLKTWTTNNILALNDKIEDNNEELTDTITNMQNDLDTKIDFDVLSDALSEAMQDPIIKDSLSIINTQGDGSKYFNFAVVTTNRAGIESHEFWILVNARYDRESKRFKRINLDNFSFGWQMQASGTYPGEESIGDYINQGVNLWKANGRKAYPVGSADYDLVTEDIGVEIDGKWYEFGYMHGWNNHFMNDSYGGMTIGGSGFEIDGSGLKPYSRVSHCKYAGRSRNPEADIKDYEFAYTGIIENSYHGLTGKDEQYKKGLFFGLKSKIEDIEPRTFIDQESTYFTIMEHPASAEDVIEEWREPYKLFFDGKIEVDPSGKVYVLKGEILNDTDYQILFNHEIPLNQENIELLQVVFTKQDGTKVGRTVSNADVALSEYGIYGFAGLDENDLPYTEVSLYARNKNETYAAEFANAKTGDSVSLDNNGNIQFNATSNINLTVENETGKVKIDSDLEVNKNTVFNSDVTFNGTISAAIMTNEEIDAAFKDAGF